MPSLILLEVSSSSEVMSSKKWVIACISEGSIAEWAAELGTSATMRLVAAWPRAVRAPVGSALGALGALLATDGSASCEA